MSRTALLAATATLAVAAAAPASGAPPSGPSFPPGAGQDRRFEKYRPPSEAPRHWIVELDDPPLATYEGGGQRDRATAPRVTHRKLDVRSKDAKAWREELDQRERAALDRAGVSVRPDIHYRTAFTGFAARMSDGEAAALRRTPGVRRVVRGKMLKVSQEPAGLAGSRQPASPAPTGEAEFLGLPDGLWQQLGGARQAGRGVIVGVVDSGITPESDSFAERDLDPPALWNGACESGERFPVTTCNDKLIGARYFVEGYGADRLPEGAFLSPRDEVGHGTHVAGIAAGNDEVDPEIAGNALGVDRITGAAPAAHVAAYKACWVIGACAQADVLAAIDAAVADGVDVLNLSLGGALGPDEKLDPVELALRHADAAGVFVAVAAGNAGEFPGAIGTPGSAPWVTTVAATTSPRTFRATVRATGADGAALELPASGSGPGVEAPLVDAAQFDEGGTNPLENPRYCIDGMTPERVKGKVVLCDPFAPLELINDVLSDAGAAGLVMGVGDRSDDYAVNQLLPTAYLLGDGAERLRKLAADGATTIAIAPASAAQWQPDRVAWFSSRGPNPGAPDVLRPDVAAPGVNVLAPFSPETFFASTGEAPHDRFAVLSGTSMASPQVAGVGALLTQLHPTWSGAQMRSALVTTAKPVVDSDGDGPAPRMAGGAGRIDPQAAADPGLVVAPTAEEYERYAEGLAPDAIPGTPEPIAPRDLNLPHLALEGAVAPVTVTRTLQSVASTRASWVARVEGVDFNAGFVVDVSPGRFTIAPGQRQQLTLEVTAIEGRPTFRDAMVVLRNQQDGREVRLPVSARNPGIVAPPRLIAADAAPPEGSKDVEVTVAGSVSAEGHGLARPQAHEIQTRPHFDGFEGEMPFEVPEGARLLSAQIPPDIASEEVTIAIVRDLDGDGHADPTEPWVHETVEDGNFARADAVDPEPGKHVLYVRLYGLDQAVAVPTSTWLVADPKPDDPEPAPGLVAEGDPFAVYPGAKRTVRLRWTGADGDQPLRGIVAWRGSGETDLATSIVDVNPGPVH